jgi:hypothetical protein
MSEKTMRMVRLPTEAEWEYACRAGTETAYSFGDDPATLADYAWYRRNSKAADGEGIVVRPVGQKKSNAWGLYDMHGNVYQFCRDWYAEDYFFQGDKVDPQGPATGQGRVKRGGSIESNERDCRSSARHHHGDSKTADGCTGLRVVVTGRPIIGLGLSDSDIDEILPKIDAIQMKAVEVRIDSAYVGKKLQGSVKVRNVGPNWDFGPMVFSPAVSVKIYDENGALLAKSGGGWGGGMKTGQEMNVHFQGGDRAGHFGTMFLFEKVGKYKATIEVHPPGLAKKVLSSVTIPFDVEPNEAARTPEAAPPSEPRIIYGAGAGPVMVGRNPNSASATTQPAVRIRPPASGPDSGGVYDPRAVTLKLVSLETKPASVGEIVSASGVVRNIGSSFPNPGLSPSRCPCYQARIYDPDGKLVFRGMFAWTVGLRANEEATIKFDTRANVLPTGARPFVIPKAGRYKLTVDIGVGMGNVMDSRTLTIDVADVP